MRGDSSSNILAHSKSFTFGGSPVLGTPMRALTSYDNISEDLFLSSGDLPKSGDAFAAFMGVESDQSAELFGELEPRNEGASHRREDYQSPAETRARGKRGGQRRKRAAGDVVGHGLQHNFENEATDCLATSMALAALSCMDEGDFE